MTTDQKKALYFKSYQAASLVASNVKEGRVPSSGEDFHPDLKAGIGARFDILSPSESSDDGFFFFSEAWQKMYKSKGSPKKSFEELEEKLDAIIEKHAKVHPSPAETIERVNSTLQDGLVPTTWISFEKDGWKSFQQFRRRARRQRS